MRRKILTTVYFDPGQLEDLKALALKDRTAYAVVMRAAVDMYLKSRRLELPPREADPRQVSLGFGGGSS